MSKHYSIALIAGALLLGAAACIRPAAAGSDTSAARARAERGRYLVTIGGCNDCHTPLKMGPKGPEPDMTRMLSGHPESFPITGGTAAPSRRWLMTMAASGTAFSGPWGVSFAANLTPDDNTGLGIWTEEMFVKAVRTGRHMGVSRPILPPMPWPNVGAMNDEDLKAVYAYLRSIQPIHNRVPEPLPPPSAVVAANRAAQPGAATVQ
jgi:mono/diheme cytochrome c family protein